MGRKILFVALGLGAVSVIALGILAGARAPGKPDEKRKPEEFQAVQEFQTEEYTVRVSPIVSGLSHPWSLAFLPDGDMLSPNAPGGYAASTTARSSASQ